MSAYQSLLWPDAGPIDVGKKSKSPRLHLRGCEFCPQNNAKGIRKVKGKVEGKDIFIWAQSPGINENSEGRELIGRAGRWFWDKMAKVGLSREDCDIQNVMRCLPADLVDGQLHMRDPLDEELFCCSLYNDQAIVRSKAKVHIVLGQFARKQLFGAKFKTEPIFWSDKLRGRVIVLTHPAAFLRGFGSKERLQAFHEGLRMAAQFAKDKGGKFSYLEKQNYVGVTSKIGADRAADEIRERAKHFRISIDLEDGWLDGEHIALCYGFSGRKGTGWVFLLDHPGPNVSRDERAAIREVVVGLLQDENIRKVCQHGSYDVIETKKLLDCRIRRYDFDTNYSEYFAYPGRRSYALAETAAIRFPEFAGFKEVIMPEAAPKGMTYSQAERAGKLNFTNVPWEKLVLRNAADADLTKRIEATTKDKVNLPLLHVYMDAAFTLDRMEKNGPWFDYKQCELLGEIYPARLKKQTEELQLMAGDPNFNPGSPAQVARVLYKKLKLPIVGKKPDTAHATLVALSQMHPFPKKVEEYRADKKLESTYRAAFKHCADEHKGRLFTKWWLTGTRTGRLSSGGSRESEDFVTVNLQNIVGDPLVENMLVSDKLWREIYDAWKEKHSEDWYKPFLDREVYLKFDYAQNELRFLAQQSGDPEYIAAFKSGKDIHSEVGFQMTGWSKDVIKNDREKRTMIKGFHFGMIYGLEVDGMIAHLLAEGVDKTLATRKRVSSWYDAYFTKYRLVKVFIKRMRAMAVKYGYVENILGFKCPIDVSGESKGGYWENLAINAPIQGGAHQVLLICLALLHRKPKEYKLVRTPESENHDAIMTRVPLRRLFEAVGLAKKLAEQDVIGVLRDEFKLDWQVPFKADYAAGFRYGVMVKLDEIKTIPEFLEKWCQENLASQQALWKEIRAARALS